MFRCRHAAGRVVVQIGSDGFAINLQTGIVISNLLRIREEHHFHPATFKRI